MAFLPIEDAMKKGKGTVALRGWVYRERGSNKFKFLVIRDSSNIIQCIVDKEKVAKKEWDDANKLLIESSLQIFSKSYHSQNIIQSMYGCQIFEAWS